MIENRFKIEDNIIVCAYLTQGDKNIVLAQGMPQYLTKDSPIINNLVQLGWNVFVPHYPGSWECSGEFTIQNAINAVQKTIQFVRQGSGKELYADSIIKWGIKTTVLIGFSFGGLIAAQNWNSVEQTILIAPLINYKLHLQNGGEDIAKTLDFLKKGYGRAYRFNKEKLLKEIESYPLPQTPKNKVIIFLGNKDTQITPEEIAWVSEMYKVRTRTIPTSHTSNIPIDILKEELP